MKKILLVSGCSFTDKNFYSGVHPEMDTSYPKWPELLAKKLDMDCINLGQNGAGNEYIYLGGEFHPDIKFVHFTHRMNRPHEWKHYKEFMK